MILIDCLLLVYSPERVSPGAFVKKVVEQMEQEPMEATR